MICLKVFVFLIIPIDFWTPKPTYRYLIPRVDRHTLFLNNLSQVWSWRTACSWWTGWLSSYFQSFISLLIPATILLFDHVWSDRPTDWRSVCRSLPTCFVSIVLLSYSFFDPFLYLWLVWLPNWVLVNLAVTPLILYLLVFLYSFILILFLDPRVAAGISRTAKIFVRPFVRSSVRSS